MLSKLSFLTLFCISFAINVSAQVYRGESSSRIIPNTDLLWVNEDNGSLNYIRFSSPEQVDESAHSTWLKKLLNAPNNVDFQLIKKSHDKLGQTHYRYAQFVNGYKIDGAQYLIHSIQNKILSANGEYSKVNNITLSAGISENQAFLKAKYEVPSEKYLWEAEKTARPQGNLVFAGDMENLKLSYKFDIYSLEPLARYYIFVDANTGEIIQKNNRIHHTSVTGTASTKYHGTQSITTDSLGATNFILRDLIRSVTTKDLNNSTSYSSAIHFTDANNIWTSTTNQDDAALDAHWGAGKTYDYFYNTYGLDSYNGLGASINSFVHYGTNYVNAFWDGSRMTYGDGNGTSYSALTSIDVVGHEITHAVTEYSANLVYSYESGALNESFSDIFGVAIDFYADPTNANWYMGDLFNITGNGFRDMANPNNKNHPDTYLGTYWHTSSSDNGGVHTNSGVQNFWYYLLTNGGTGTNDNSDAYSVTSIGITDASAIAYRNLSVYLTTNSQYSHARFYAIQSAIDLFGSCSTQEIATTNAWHAVGIGSIYSNSVTANFTGSQTYFCTTPASASFVNLSTNDSARLWDFGDGSTDTAFAPTHTYTSTGNYTVTLITYGSTSCGASIDTLILTNYITVTNTGGPTSASCIPIATTGFANYGIFNFTLNTINHTTLGASDGYKDYTCSQTTTVMEGDILNMSIDCGVVFANVRVYIDYSNNGAFSASELVYSGSGYNVQTTTLVIPAVTSNNTPLRVRVISDSYTITNSCSATVNTSQIEDYSINITPLSTPPIANFTANPTTISTGSSVPFTNSSSGLPTSYAWSFPGGSPSSSTATNPTISYATTGNYNVQLIATNAFGSDTLLKTAYINVSNQVNMCGTITSSSSLTGLLYDDGGPTGYYSNSKNCYFLIQPTCADSITLSFSSFNFESGYDYIRVYDGTTTGSTQILYASGTSLPSAVTATSGAMYVYFHTDGSVTRPGFAAAWSTVQMSSAPPVASFTISNTNPPLGATVNFTDQTTNTPVSWNWNFGNGNNSVLQNPSSTYLNSGTHTIELIASTCGFSDTVSNTLIVQASPTISTNPTSVSHTFNSCVDSITIPITIYNTGMGDLVLDSINSANASNFLFPQSISDTLGIGDSITFNVTLSALGLPIGTYQDSVAIFSNDSTTPVFYIPVNMINNGTAYLDVDSTCIAFDTVLQYLGDSISVHILNPGCDTLHVTGLTLGTSAYSVSVTTLTIPPFSTDSVWVNMASTSLGWQYDTLSITTNTNDTTVCISGYMEGSPIISTQPDTLNVTITNCNDSVVVPMWVYNTGDADLNFNTTGNGSSSNGTLNLLVWKYGVDLSTGINGEYQNTMNAINSYFTNYNLIETLTTDSLVMQGLLANASALLIPEQELTIGTVNQQMANSIQNFVANGGWLILCGNSATNYINDIGILNATGSGSYNSGSQIIVDASSPLLNNTIPPIVNANGNYPKTFSNTGFNTVTSYSGYSEVGDLNYGSGKVIWISYDYYQYNTNAQKIIANAVEWASIGAVTGSNWVYTNPDSGTVAPGDSMLIYVTVNGTGMLSGFYQGNLNFSSNDPVTPNWVVPVNLTIIGSPELTFSDSCIAFDTTMQFTSDTLGIWVHNSGCDTLNISNTLSGNSDISFSDTTFMILPGDTAFFDVYFTPDTLQTYSGLITFVTNIGDSTICFSGDVIGSPQISLNPDSIYVTINCNDSIVIPVTVSNTGTGPLNFNISGPGSGGSSTGTLNVFAWTYGADMSTEYPNTISAINTYFTNYSLVQSNTTVLTTFQSYLANADVLLIPEQESTVTYGNQLMASSIQNFVNNGGWVIICGNNSTKINYLGLFNITSTSTTSSGSQTIIDATSPLLNNITTTIYNESLTSSHVFSNTAYNSVSANGSYSAVGDMGLGSGKVIYVGFDFFASNTNTKRIIANAIEWAANSAVNWTIASPDTGNLIAGDSTIINVTIWGDSLNPGVYQTSYVFNSNDPANPSVTLPVVVNVIGVTELWVSDSCINVGSLNQFVTTTDSFQISSIGCDTLLISSITSSNASVIASSPIMTLPDGDSVWVTANITPTTVGSFLEYITINTNGNDSTICVTGNVLGSSIIHVDPIPSGSMRLCDTVFYRNFYVKNTGNANLNWSYTQSGTMPTLTPSSGIVIPGDSMLVVAAISNSGSVGSYIWNLSLVSNAPQTPTYNLPLNYTITNEPCVDFNFIVISTCDGVVSFSDQSSGNVISYSWDFDDGNTSTSANPTHTFTSSGSYDVELIICGVTTCDTLTQSIIVTSSNSVQGASCYPVSSNPTTNTGILAVNLNTLNNSTSNSTEGFQDFSCSMGTQLTMNINQTITVTTVSSSNQIVKAWIDFNNDGFFGGNELIMLSIGTGNHADVFTPPANSVLNTPVRMRIKTDISTATNTGACDNPIDGQTEDYYVEIIPNTIPPTANYSDSVSVDCSGIVLFTDLTQHNPTSWAWDFGDGTTSSIQNPIHQYATNGIFAVKLVATNAFGSDSLTQNILVDKYDVGFSYSGFMNANQTINFSQTGGNSISWDWNFGDGNISAIANPSNIYSQSGTYYVTLHTENNKGCQASFTDTISIEHPLSIDNADESYEASLHPNPNNGDFTFTYNGISPSLKLVLVSTSGQTIFIKDYQVNGSINIDFNNLNLAAGVYFLQVKSESQFESIQFVVR